jgi:hypothetical protein
MGSDGYMGVFVVEGRRDCRPKTIVRIGRMEQFACHQSVGAYGTACLALCRWRAETSIAGANGLARCGRLLIKINPKLFS